MQNSLSQQSSQQQNLQQTQQLTPNQLQGLNILAAPIQELGQLLANELLDNPLLEVTAPGREELAGDPLSDAAAANNEIHPDEFEGAREDYPLLDSLFQEWEESAFADYASAQEDESTVQKRRDYQFDSLVAAKTLADILYEQLDFCDLSAKERQAAELVFSCLDEKGFLTTPAADIAMSGNLSMQEALQAVKLVQSFDPPGVAARDTAECWIIQLQRRQYPDQRIYQLLTDCRDDLEHNRLPKIAKTLNTTIEDIYDMLAVLKSLNSVPTAGLETAGSNVNVIPEMSIVLENNELQLHVPGNTLPKLGIVRQYLQMLEKTDTPEETCKYLREKLASAENLIKSLELRQSTLTRITQIIAQKQADYFRYGTEFLQPMTMAEIAQTLELNDSTISRAVAGKYLDTPQGLKEYRFFFSGGYKTSDGEDVSSRGVKELIRAMIEEENPQKPLSDAAISQKLSEQGLDVARRTVAKYRESMNIAATNLRRRH